MTRFELTMRIYDICEALHREYGMGEVRLTQLQENAAIVGKFHQLADDLKLPKES